MSVKPEDLLEYSATLCHATSEVANRAAVCRAYYSSYHRALEWHASLPSQGACLMSNVGAHEHLIQSLITPTVADNAVKMKSRSVGYMLRQQKAARLLADYDLECDIDCSIAETAVENARTLLSKIG